MEAAIAGNPEGHPVVPGAAGVRKARWARPGTGKSGGIRLIYYFWATPNAVLFIAAYAKNEKETLSDADKKEIRKLIENLKKSC
ncbi:MAG: type II toxin-antitoxin system RelE/ParE family toxin [Terriglobia bacterium]